MIFVGPDEGGRVTKLNVREGDTTHQGDLIYTVDDDLQRWQTPAWLRHEWLESARYLALKNADGRSPCTPVAWRQSP